MNSCTDGCTWGNLRLLLDMIRQPVIMTDGKCVFFANQAAVNLFGHDAEKMPPQLMELALDDTIIGIRTGVEAMGTKYTVIYEPVAGYKAIILETVEESTALYEQISKIALAVNREFRMPLTMMFSAANLLAEDMDKNKKTRKYLSIINQNSYRLLRTTNNIFDLAGQILGENKLSLALIDIAQLCRSVVRAVEPVAAGMKIRLLIETSPEKIVGSFDADGIERMLYNMLSNALKYTPPGGQISVRTVLKDERVFITVTDTGEGISEKVLPYVYERFSMVEKTDENPSGFGIGLSIVKAIAEMHGGAVVLESRRGEGTKITVSLPVQARTEHVLRETSRPVDYAGGFSRILLEFSELLGSEHYVLGQKNAEKPPMQ